MIRQPTDNIPDIKDSILDIISTLDGSVRFEVKRVDFNAVAAGTLELIVTSNALQGVEGAIQIASTTTEIPAVQYNNDRSVKVTYSFGATTSGKQTSSFLMIGKGG